MLSTLTSPLVRYGVGAIALFVYLIFTFFFIPGLAGIAGPPPDTWFLGYGPGRLAEYLQDLGEGGRRAYRLFLEADMLFAPLYGVALAGWVAYLGGRPARALAPLAAAALDEAENLLLISQLSAPSPVVGVVLGFVTPLKWLMIAHSFFWLLLGAWERWRS